MHHHVDKRWYFCISRSSKSNLNVLGILAVEGEYGVKEFRILHPQKNNDPTSQEIDC